MRLSRLGVVLPLALACTYEVRQLGECHGCDGGDAKRVSNGGDAPSADADVEPGDSVVAPSDLVPPGGDSCVPPDPAAACSTVECGAVSSCDGIINCPCPYGELCDNGTCSRVDWFPIGSSELGPRFPRIGTSATAGGVSASLTASREPVVALSPNGSPIVAWSEERVGGGRLQARRWAIDRWEPLGDPEAAINVADARAARPSMAATDSAVYLAWDGGSPTDVYVAYWNGDAWSGLGPSAEAGGLSGSAGTSSYAPQVVVQPLNGWPAVVWVDAIGAESHVRYAEWDPVRTLWTNRGGSDSVGTFTSAFSAALALALAGAPHIALVDAAGQLFVVAWDDRLITPAWTGLDNSDTATGISSVAAGDPSIALDTLGRPVVAWIATRSGSLRDVWVMRFEGTWQALGGSATVGGVSNSGLAANPTVLTRGDDVISVVWNNTAGSVFWATWNGVAWSAPALVNAGTGVATRPSAAVDPTGALLVGWEDRTSSPSQPETYVRRRGEDGWSDYGAPPPGASLSNDNDASISAALAFADDGSPFVAWLDDDAARDLPHLSRWVDSYWSAPTPLNALAPAVRGENPSLAVRDAAHPFVAFATNDVNEAISVQRWEGSGWVSLSATLNSGVAAADPPVLASIDGSQVVIAWSATRASNKEVYVARWDGASWQAYGQSRDPAGISNTLGESGAPAMDVDGGDNPVVAWAEGAYGIHVKRWSLGAWREHAGSATGFGLGTNNLAAQRPRLAVDASGRMVVAWIAGVGMGRHIEVRRSTATGWESLPSIVESNGLIQAHSLTTAGDRPFLAWQDGRSGQWQAYVVGFDEQNGWQALDGSDMDGGISNSTGAAHEPSIAATTEVVCVAWHTGAATALQVVLRCHDL